MTRVLVVDDSTLARKILIKSFPKDWNVEVAQLTGGADAVAACRQEPPEVMFLDLNMPDVDGYGVLAALQGGAMPKVIVVSADVQPIARERVLAMGACAMIRKPATAPELEAALREVGAFG